MTRTTELPVREPTLLEFPTDDSTPLRRWTARGQNFAVTWLHASEAAVVEMAPSPDETLLLILDADATITCDGAPSKAPARSIGIVPAGKAFHIDLSTGATVAAIASLREDAPTAVAHNENAYAERDRRIRPVGAPFVRSRAEPALRLHAIDEIAAPVDKPRLKMLQTSTLSINWVEYDGPRDNQALSPHAHAEFEQGSLGLQGDFSHHLRVPWGNDSTLWQDDRHVVLKSPSLMVVPVGMIHTSEGTGAGHHLLIDVFSPPRADFIAKGWVANAHDYLPAGAAEETVAR